MVVSSKVIKGKDDDDMKKSLNLSALPCCGGVVCSPESVLGINLPCLSICSQETVKQAERKHSNASSMSKCLPHSLSNIWASQTAHQVNHGPLMFSNTNLTCK